MLSRQIGQGGEWGIGGWLGIITEMLSELQQQWNLELGLRTSKYIWKATFAKPFDVGRSSSINIINNGFHLLCLYVSVFVSVCSYKPSAISSHTHTHAHIKT